MKIAVVGGGCVGLTTALIIQEKLRNAHLDLIAENFEQTTSHVAAGIFRVGAAYSSPSESITRKWITDAYSFYEAIVKSREASEAGVSRISGYIFSNSHDNVKNEWMEGLVPIYRRVNESEMIMFGDNWKYGCFISTLLTQPNQYLKWAKNKLIQSGAILITKPIISLKELAKDYDLIMNCTGLGAKILCQDRKMIPIKGQVIKVRAPWLRTFSYGEINTYVIPGSDGLTTLGGLRDFESSDLTVCPYQAAAIRDRCERLVPSLKKAELVAHKTGLRPHREGGVRVEVEKINDGSYCSAVVHNYGHGGYGICTAPGTSKYAVELAEDALRTSSKL
ncbi:PREDICTED: D-amino-acid oxidase-like [Ceratosolen solmsi marchali]|uniref:D-amino-acid oxidase-like n=1 Tax=Ceratosolen solmsi marchali TaxID=326594 RepID=A0AAJ6YJX7_9HYME|nr:PREDICTED: D-amino-acid oxidase-like [Ceratosolen solmsi marchali]